MLLKAIAAFATVALALPAHAATMIIDFETFEDGSYIPYSPPPTKPADCGLACILQPGGGFGKPIGFVVGEGSHEVRFDPTAGIGHYVAIETRIKFVATRLNKTTLFVPRVQSFDVYSPNGGTYYRSGQHFAVGRGWTTISAGPARFFGITGVDNIVYDPIFATVPEPGTWALLIGGFAMIGGALRLRRRDRRAEGFA